MDNNINFDEISKKVIEQFTSKIDGNDTSSELTKLIFETSVKSSVEVLKEYHKITNCK